MKWFVLLSIFLLHSFAVLHAQSGSAFELFRKSLYQSVAIEDSLVVKFVSKEGWPEAIVNTNVIVLPLKEIEIYTNDVNAFVYRVKNGENHYDFIATYADEKTLISQVLVGQQGGKIDSMKWQLLENQLIEITINGGERYAYYWLTVGYSEDDGLIESMEGEVQFRTNPKTALDYYFLLSNYNVFVDDGSPIEYSDQTVSKSSVAGGGFEMMLFKNTKDEPYVAVTNSIWDGACSEYRDYTLQYTSTGWKEVDIGLNPEAHSVYPYDAHIYFDDSLNVSVTHDYCDPILEEMEENGEAIPDSPSEASLKWNPEKARFVAIKQDE
jgi:hypothetical protein